MSDTVLAETRGAVRLLTLNRPGKLNAINSVLTADLTAALSAANADDNVAAVVLTGAGRAFSAGADMKEAASHADASHRSRIQTAGRSTALYEAIMEIDKPVIAAVSGYALGGGCALVMASDIVIAGENAIFGYPEVKRGLAATAVTPTLVAQIGRKWASELLLLCENVPARRAAEIGLVNRVVSDGEVVETAMTLAAALAGFSHDALWATKRMIRRSADLTLSQAHGLARDNMLMMRGFELEKQ